jgi:toxin ParE1/3/4
MAENTDFPVILSEAAIADMSALGRWIAERTSPEVAEAYVARVEAACYRLADFPNRGTPRFDISQDLRSVAFERRVIIAYRIENGEVRIVRVIPAARDFARAFGND